MAAPYSCIFRCPVPVPALDPPFTRPSDPRLPQTPPHELVPQPELSGQGLARRKMSLPTVIEPARQPPPFVGGRFQRFGRKAARGTHIFVRQLHRDNAEFVFDARSPRVIYHDAMN